MASLFGKELGPVLAAFVKILKDAVEDAYCHRRFILADLIEFFMEIQKKLLHGQVRADVISSMLKKYALDQMEIRIEMHFHKEYNVSNAGWTDLIMQEDLQQPFYLYELGLPVAKQEEKLQAFLAALPQEEVDQIAKAIIKILEEF